MPRFRIKPTALQPLIHPEQVTLVVPATQPLPLQYPPGNGRALHELGDHLLEKQFVGQIAIVALDILSFLFGGLVLAFVERSERAV